MDTAKPFKNIKITIGVNRMCLALSYSYEKKIFITHFTDDDATVLIKTNKGLLQTIKWGRRLDEKGKLPLGGWISQELKAKGIYDKFFPKEVKICAIKFMEQDVQGRCVWSDITAGWYLQGLLLQERDERRVYLVTFTPEKHDTPFTRWPIISAG